MQKLIALSFVNLLLIVCVRGQFADQMAKQRDTDQRKVLVMHIRAAIKNVKIPENQYLYITDNGIITLMGFLDERSLCDKTAGEALVKKQCMEIYTALKEGRVGSKKVQLDELSFCHFFWNRAFMQYNNNLTSVCIVKNGVIKEFEMATAPVKATGYINVDIYKKLVGFKLKPNQYMGPHKLEKETLVLANTVIDASVDRKKESDAEFRRFKKSVRSITPYKRVLVRYQCKYDPSQGKDYYYIL